MNTPLLPEKPADEKGFQPRYMPRPEVLRIIAGAIALVGALIGLMSRLEPSHPPAAVAPIVAPPIVQVITTLSSPVVSKAVYGMPTLAALRPATTLSNLGRRVCIDEQRPKPNSGAWSCNLWHSLDYDEIGVQAVDPGGPCTHRRMGDGAETWLCWTRIAIPKAALAMPARIPVFFGDLQTGNGIDHRRVPGICWDEVRASPHGAWRCEPLSWRALVPGFHGIQVVDPGGLCVSRIVDENTGVWFCQQRT